MILFLFFLLSSLQIISCGTYSTEIDYCIRNGVTVSPGTFISERNITRRICGFLLKSNGYIMVQINKITISTDTSIRLYLVTPTNGSICNKKIYEYHSGPPFRNHAFVKSGRQKFALVVLSKNNSKDVGEFEFVFRTRCDKFSLVPHQHHGMLTYNHNPVCQNRFNVSNAKVYCRYLGYPGVRKVYEDPINTTTRLMANLQCNGSETSPAECRAKFSKKCKANYTIGVICQDVELTGGNDTNEGLPVIYSEGRKFLLWDHDFDIRSGNVICKQLGFRYVVRVLLDAGSVYGTAKGVISENDLRCLGNENSIHECPRNDVENQYFPAFQEFGVVCSKTAPVLFPTVPHHHQGVLVYKNRKVCHNSWNFSNGKVYCRSLGYPGVRQTYKNYIFDSTNQPMVNLQCTGSEMSLDSCLQVDTRYCERNFAVGVVCQDVALAGSNETNEGRVEVYYQGRRGPLCSYHFNMNVANVICRQLGFRSAVTISFGESNKYGLGNGVSLLGDLQCLGNEYSIHECPWKVFQSRNCDRGEVSAVVCSAEETSVFSLVPHHHHGAMLYNNSVVCKNKFIMNNANVFCHSLGYPGIRHIFDNSSFDTSGLSFVNLQCQRFRKSTVECLETHVSNCEGNVTVGVLCQDVALVGGNHANEGRVEIYYKGRRGPLCADNFNINSGNVICRQLGFRFALRVYLADDYIYGSGDGFLVTHELRCLGHETSIHECPQNALLRNNCRQNHAAGVVCADEEPGTSSVNPHSNQVLLRFKNIVVCHNSFDMNNAKIYCRSLGYSGVKSIVKISLFNTTGGFVVNLQCKGSEKSLADCTAALARHCQGNSITAVVCRGKAPLPGGNDTNKGRAEIYYKEPSVMALVPHDHHGFMLHNNSVVCHNSFNMNNAKVYCRYLGYPGVGKVYKKSSFDTSGRQFVNLQCQGFETSPADCHVAPTKRCKKDFVVEVVCQDVALAGSENTNEGRVEIYLKGRRGLLCDTHFNIRSGNVICKQLGFKSAVNVSLRASKEYGFGNGLFLLDNLRCLGNENSIHECPQKAFGSHNCQKEKVAGLVCKDPNIIYSVPYYHHSILSYHNKHICENRFRISNAKVYCRYLGYPGVKSAFVWPQFDNVGIVNVQCKGSERSLDKCFVGPAKECEHGTIVRYSCQDVALAGDKRANEGRVEVYNNKGKKGLLCDDRFDMNAGNVICRQLGFRSALKVLLNASEIYGYGDGVFMLSELQCLGDENSIDECPRKVYKDQNCTDDNVGGLVCTKKGREIYSLVPHDHHGLSLHNNSAVCLDSFNVSNAKVYCRYLGYPGVREVYESSPLYTTRRLFVDLQCQGFEMSPTECHVSPIGNCASNSVLGIVCQDVALVGGKRTNEGRVEIYHKGRRGLLCNHHFDVSVGHVICRQLGFRSAVEVVLNVGQVDGVGNGAFKLDDIECLGSERTIHECSRKVFKRHVCLHSQVPELICSPRD